MNLVNVCPDIPDRWVGGCSDVARLLCIDRKTVCKYAALGKRNGGIDWRPGRRGRVFTGKEVKRLFNILR